VIQCIAILYIRTGYFTPYILCVDYNTSCLCSFFAGLRAEYRTECRTRSLFKSWNFDLWNTSETWSAMPKRGVIFPENGVFRPPSRVRAGSGHRRNQAQPGSKIAGLHSNLLMLRRFNVPRNFARKRTFSFHDKRKSTQKENRWNRMVAAFFSRCDRSFSFQFAPQKKKNQKETGSTGHRYVPHPSSHRKDVIIILLMTAQR